MMLLSNKVSRAQIKHPDEESKANAMQEDVTKAITVLFQKDTFANYNKWCKIMGIGKKERFLTPEDPKAANAQMARPAPFASRSVRRALSTSQVNPGSRYRRRRSTYEQSVGHTRRKGA